MAGSDEVFEISKDLWNPSFPKSLPDLRRAGIRTTSNHVASTEDTIRLFLVNIRQNGVESMQISVNIC
jgi:hypothetical protein